MFKMLLSLKEFKKVTVNGLVGIVLLSLIILGVNVDIVLFIGIIILMINLLLFYPNFVIRYIMIFFMSLGNLLGVFICEHENIWLSELSVSSEYVGSFPLLCLGWGIFIFTVWILDQKKTLQVENQKFEFVQLKFGHFKFSIQTCLVLGLIICSTLLLIHVIPHPAFLEHLDRFAFQKKYITTLWKHVLSIYYAGLPLLLSIIIANKAYVKSLKVPAYISIIEYCVFLFFSGEKFGGFWYVIVISCIVFSIKGQNIDVKKIRKIFFKLTATSIILLIILAAHITLTYGSAEVSNYLPQRIAQQGQLWWATYKQDKNNYAHIDELDDEFQTYFQFSDINEKKYNHAIYKIMRFVTPDEIFQQKIESGSRYSTSTFASMFYYFKTPGIILFAFLGAGIYWLLMRWFMNAIKSGYIIEILLMNKLLTLYYPTIAMSEFNAILQFKPFLFFVVVIFMMIFREYLERKKYVEANYEA